MRWKNIKILKKELLIFILIIPYFKPDYFSYIPVIRNIYSLLKFIFLYFLILQFLSVWIRNKIKWNGFLLLIISLNLFPILRMFLVTGWNGEPIKQFIDVIALILIFEIYQKDWNALIRALMTFFELMVYANFITILVFPQGLYHEGLYWDNWLLGYSNSEVKYLMVAGLISIIYSCITKTKKRSVILSCVVVITLLRLASVTGIVGMTVMIGLYLLQSKRKINIFNLKNVAVATAICFIYFIIEQNIVKYVDIIAKVTGKTVTFTSRFNIWAKTIDLWLKNPMMGYGWKTSVQRGIEYRNIYATNAHNTYLEYLYLGGIIELVLFIVTIYMIYRIAKLNQGTVAVKSIYACMGGFLIMMLTEAYTSPTVQFIYILCYYVASNLTVIDQEPVG